MSIFQKALLLCCLLLLPLSAAAQTKPQIYTIKQGDTLWGISQRFIKDPYYWPNLWSHNPFVTNPHLIYPGQKVAIYDGRIVFLPEFVEPGEGEQPETVAETALPEPQPELTVKAFSSTEGFISLGQLETAGTLVDATDNRLLMVAEDLVFVEIEAPQGLQPGDLYTLIQVGKKIEHPVTGKALGHQTSVVGQVRIVQSTPPIATAVIVRSDKEILRGARLIPSQLPQQEITLHKAQQPLSGYIISGENEKLALSQHDIIFIDLGHQDGLQQGNMLYITRPRKQTKAALQGHHLPLPDALLGAAVVVSTHAETAAALVLKSTDAIYAGDRVITPAE
ncbi:MAG: LysM peptidoglycan-binding domain-containing protein [Desulfuromonadaceae bacterium]|nr:LysM peptidoglycan-binding domain-containing protein [Desulfuromonadaceae bacterium]